MCKAGNKLFANWFQLESTKSLINEAVSDIGITIFIQKIKISNFLYIRMNNNNNNNNNNNKNNNNKNILL